MTDTEPNGDPTAEPASDRPMAGENRSPKRAMCSAVLSLEAITLALTAPVLISVLGVSVGAALGVGLGLAVACLLVAGMLRAPWAYALGWGIQIAAVGLGLVIPTMFVLGGIFALLWAGAIYLGKRIETERAEAFAAYRGKPPAED